MWHQLAPTLQTDSTTAQQHNSDTSNNKNLLTVVRVVAGMKPAQVGKPCIFQGCCRARGQARQIQVVFDANPGVRDAFNCPPHLNRRSGHR